MKSLGEWQRLFSLAEEAWSMDPVVLPHSKVAPLGARAAWALGKWDSMLKFVTKTHEADLQVRVACPAGPGGFAGGVRCSAGCVCLFLHCSVHCWVVC